MSVNRSSARSALARTSFVVNTPVSVVGKFVDVTGVVVAKGVLSNDVGLVVHVPNQAAVVHEQVVRCLCNGHVVTAKGSAEVNVMGSKLVDANTVVFTTDVDVVVVDTKGNVVVVSTSVVGVPGAVKAESRTESNVGVARRVAS